MNGTSGSTLTSFKDKGEKLVKMVLITESFFSRNLLFSKNKHSVRGLKYSTKIKLCCIKSW